MSLEQWLRNGWIQPLEPTVAQIRQLLEVVERELSDAEAVGISADGRFEHAYHAALQLCMIALNASGYRVAKGEGHHKRGIDSLGLTLGRTAAETATYLEICSRKRGQAMYERTGVVNQNDADDLLRTAKQLRTEVLAWLKADHPALLK
jgi:hypothetical protein